MSKDKCQNDNNKFFADILLSGIVRLVILLANTI